MFLCYSENFDLLVVLNLWGFTRQENRLLSLLFCFHTRYMMVCSVVVHHFYTQLLWFPLWDSDCIVYVAVRYVVSITELLRFY